MASSLLNKEVEQHEATASVPAAGSHYTPPAGKDEKGRIAETAVQTIQRSPDDLYALWSNLAFFPRWQEFVISVTPHDEETSHWVMGNPEDEKGKRIEFDSKIVENIPGQKIAWESITPEVDVAGHVTFVAAASGRGTVVTLHQATKVPGGTLGNAFAGVAARSPRQIVVEDLRHLKQFAETGEIPSVKGQPHGPRGIAGGIKEWMYGDENPTPPGSSVSE